MPPLWSAATAFLPLESMESLAQSLAERLRPADVVTLNGDVGAGKTTFARALIRRLAPDAMEVTSPTFTLMQSYDIRLGTLKPEILWHLDLYRIEHPDELSALGLEELLPHVTLIEWPEIARPWLPDTCLGIAFDFDTDAQSRRLIFSGNDAWRGRLDGLLIPLAP